MLPMLAAAGAMGGGGGGGGGFSFSDSGNATSGVGDISNGGMNLFADPRGFDVSAFARSQGFLPFGNSGASGGGLQTAVLVGVVVLLIGVLIMLRRK